MKAAHITDIKTMILKLNEIIEHENNQLEALETLIQDDPNEHSQDDNNVRAESVAERIEVAENTVIQLKDIVELASKYEADP